MEARRDVFQAIADPTRREIIGMLAQKSLNVNALAHNFDMSRQAISLHVKILNECGLISIRQEGRDRYCDVQLKQLNEVSTWVEQYRKFWDKKLDALESYLDNLQKTKKVKKKKSR